MIEEQDEMKNVPQRFRAACEFCPHEVDIRKEGTHQFTSGWVKVRDGGGGHGISLAKRENRWAHGHCIDREVRGFGQTGSMFG